MVAGFGFGFGFGSLTFAFGFGFGRASGAAAAAEGTARARAATAAASVRFTALLLQSEALGVDVERGTPARRTLRTTKSAIAGGPQT